MTPSGIEPATFRFVAQHLNHCATAVPDGERAQCKNVGVYFQIMKLRTCLYRCSGLEYFSHYAGLAAPRNVESVYSLLCPVTSTSFVSLLLSSRHVISN